MRFDSLWIRNGGSRKCERVNEEDSDQIVPQQRWETGVSHQFLPN
jgi:hypothetical protein